MAKNEAKQYLVLRAEPLNSAGKHLLRTRIIHNLPRGLVDAHNRHRQTLRDHQGKPRITDGEPTFSLLDSADHINRVVEAVRSKLRLHVHQAQAKRLTPFNERMGSIEHSCSWKGKSRNIDTIKPNSSIECSNVATFWL